MIVGRFPVGIVAERRPARSPWLDHVVAVAGVLPQPQDRPAWDLVAAHGDVLRYFAGNAEIVARAPDTKGYKDNLEGARPAVYVVMRRGGGPLGWSLLLATVDPAEAQAHGESGDDLLEAVPMPPAVRAWLRDFVTHHHVERPHYKRRRDRVDPEAGGRRPAQRP